MNQIGRNMMKHLCQNRKTLLETQKVLKKSYLCRSLSIQPDKRQKETLFPKFTNSASKLVIDPPLLDKIKNNILLHGYIQQAMDPTIDPMEIYEESLKKIEFVCKKISERDYKSIEESKYLTDYFYHDIMAHSSSFTSKQIERFGLVLMEDFVHFTIYKVYTIRRP